MSRIKAQYIHVVSGFLGRSAVYYSPSQWMPLKMHGPLNSNRKRTGYPAIRLQSELSLMNATIRSVLRLFLPGLLNSTARFPVGQNVDRPPLLFYPRLSVPFFLNARSGNGTTESGNFYMVIGGYDADENWLHGFQIDSTCRSSERVLWKSVTFLAAKRIKYWPARFQTVGPFSVTSLRHRLLIFGSHYFRKRLLAFVGMHFFFIISMLINIGLNCSL